MIRWSQVQSLYSPFLQALLRHYDTLTAPFFQQATVSMFRCKAPGWAGGPQLGTVLAELNVGAINGRFEPEKPVTGVLRARDMSKAHTSVLCELSARVPVFYYNDTFVAYNNGDAIDDDSFYLVNRDIGLRHGRPPLHPASLLLLVLNKYTNLVTGRTLRLVMTHPDFAEHFRVHSSVRPSRVVNVQREFLAALRALYADPLVSVANRKFLVNCIVGRLGRKTFIEGTTSVFRDKEDANMHAHLAGYDAAHVQQLAPGLYALHRETISDLRDHRGPAYFSILDITRRRLFAEGMRIHTAYPAIKIVAAKTDCLFLDCPANRVLPLEPKSTDVEDIIAGAHWHTEEAQLLELPERAPYAGIEQVNLLPDISPRAPLTEITMTEEQEYSEEYLAGVYKLGDFWLTSDVPGGGKSRSVMVFARSLPDGTVVLFVTPLNRLNAFYKQQGFSAVTPHQLLGLVPSDSGRGETFTRARKPMDLSGVDVIVFDEFAAVVEIFRDLWAQVRCQYPHLHAIYIGDARQLPPIEYNLNFSGEEAEVARFKACMSGLVDRVVRLRVCKRVSSPEDRALVYAMYREFWEVIGDWKGAASMKQVLSLLPEGRVITRVEDIPANAAVVTFHVDTAEALGVELARRDQPEDAIMVGNKQLTGISRPFYVWPDVVLRSNSNAKLSTGKYAVRLINNGLYRVLTINQHKKQARLVLDLDGEQQDEPIEVGYAGLVKWFSHGAYTSTGHSWQGATARDRPLVLTDVYSPFVTRHWLWMALTRGDDMSNVYILDPSSAEAARYGFGVRDWRGFMSRAIASYKQQDQQAGRTFADADFVTVDDWWGIMASTGASCFHCGQVCDTHSERLATLDRVVGTVAHTKTNVVLSCKACNVARG